MIRHRQTPHVPGVRPGNCIQVCLAGIFDEPVLGRIPHVAWLDPEFGVPNKFAWWGVIVDTVRRYGCDIWVASSADRQTPLPPDSFPADDLLPAGQELVGVVGCGPSPRGPWGHAVIVDRDGELLHDPHPSGLGVPFLDELWLITRQVAA